MRGRPLLWSACCGPLLDSGQPAPDAEALMRSRYSAYVRQDSRYLLSTWHPDTRPAELEFEPGVRWLGLSVQGHWQPAGDAAEVRFIARLRHAGGRAQRIHEHSRFRRVEGRWLYVDGDDLAV